MNRWKSSGKLLGKMAALVLVCIVGGYLLLAAVFALSGSAMLNRAEEACIDLLIEGQYPVMLSGRENTVLDNFTDAIMLNIAICSEGSVWERAAAGRHIVSDGTRQSDHLAAAIERARGADVGEVSSYARYWHGYVVFLRPLLFLFNLSDLRLLNGLLHLLLVTAVTVCAVKQGRAHVVLPIVLAYFLLTPLALTQSLQYSDAFYITFAAMLLVLKCMQAGRQVNIPLLFTGIGIAVCYFDFLTYPIVTLGLPLAMLLLCETRPFRAQLQRILQSTAAWAFGYFGMWFGKWVVAALVTDAGIFADVISQIRFRMSAQDAHGNSIGIFDILNGSTDCYAGWVYLLLFVAVTLYYGIRGLWENNDLGIAARRLPPFLLVGLLPLAWSLFAKNHTYIHTFFTHRNGVITWFCYFCMWLQWGCQKELQQHELPAQPPDGSASIENL